MAYSEKVKLRAYNFYLQGQNYEQIAEKLSTAFHINITPQTIRGWAFRKDKDGFCWSEQREGIRESVRKNMESNTHDKLSELESKAEALQNSLYSQMIDSSAPKVGSFEGGVYAFKALADFRMSLDKNASEKHPLVLVQILLEVLEQNPRVKKVISENWNKIQKQLSEKIGKKEFVIGDEQKQ